MRFIRKIEVKYFRSVYSASIKTCNHLNILSGRNDVGKSNFLRALNLFFNRHIDRETPLLFKRVFSIQRLEQVRKETVKGKQFIQVSVEFERPSNYKKSLPPRFTVKRTWFRSQRDPTQSDDLAARDKAGKCPSGLSTAQRMLPQFLNRIHYEYVPAVKDRAFYDHVLSRLQSSILGGTLDEADPITATADSLANHISRQIIDLQNDFSRATELETTIETPRELASPFQAFQVSVPTGDSRTPLALHGDGMQARYIPSVLNYIAAKSPSFFVWGFEEPENSLEYANADSLADDFENRYSKNAQIFLTTHSPAIVSRSKERSTCYRVYQEEGNSAVESVSSQSLSAGEKLNKEIGFLRIQQEIHASYKSKIKELHETKTMVSQLEADMARLRKPLILVEGKADKAILETAWNKLNHSRNMPFILRAADPLTGQHGRSGGGANSVKNAIESIHPEDGRKALAIFDHDREGKKAFDKLSNNFRYHQENPYIKTHSN